MGRHDKEHKKSRKNKHKKKHHKRSSSWSNSEEERVEKKLEFKKKRHQSSSSNSSEDEWIEKDVKSAEDSSGQSTQKQHRDEWMSLPLLVSSSSHLDIRKEKENAKRRQKLENEYDPRKSSRELNPYWKMGDGLPTLKDKFKKPNEEGHHSRSVKTNREANWRKKQEGEIKEEPIQKIESESNVVTDDFLTDKEMNELGAKIVKAEILGNTDLAKRLKEKLERAQQNRGVKQDRDDHVILTQTDSKGFSKPLELTRGESSGKRKKRVETHSSGTRVRYFPDDDKYSLKQMFQNEKFDTDDQESEFVKMASKISKSDDMDDVFADNIRKKESSEKTDKRNRDRAVKEHEKISESLDNCQRCLQSETMPKHLMVAMGQTVYLSLPPYEPLTEGHCLIIPTRHVSCSTQLDENEWSEILDFRKALTRMFQSKEDDVIFFETAMSLHRYPHMEIQCIPVPKEQGDLAPIYFKKAIDECETEWSTNKKLVNLAGKDVRKAVPKGLSYFFVSFGMDEGYAHVIEDQKEFPNNFAQEVIGGMLDAHHSKWRKPVREKFEQQKNRVMLFSEMWKDYDVTV